MVGGWWLVVALVMKFLTKDITVQIPTEPMGCYANVLLGNKSADILTIRK